MKRIAAVAIFCVSWCLVTARLTAEQRRHLIAYNGQCSEETNFDIELVMKLRQGQFPDSDKWREYALCMAKKIGFVDADGKIQISVVADKVAAATGDVAAAAELANQCAQEVGDSTFALVRCIYDKSPTHVLIL